MKIVTILSLFISFTALSQKKEPKDTSFQVNRLLTQQLEEIQAQKVAINKHESDKVMTIVAAKDSTLVSRVLGYQYQNGRIFLRVKPK